MVDRSPLTLTVHTVPAHRVGVVLDVVEDFQLTSDTGPDNGNRSGRNLTLGTAYLGEEIYLGADEEIPGRLRRYAPDACWSVQQDPKYDNPGLLHVHVPGLGTYVGTCDAGGRQTPDPSSVRAALTDPAALSELFGFAYLDAVAALKQSGVVIAEPDRCEVFWRQRTGQGWIPVDDRGPIPTFREPRVPAGHTPSFDDLDLALVGIGWAVLGPWTRYSAGGIWSTQASRIVEQHATGPAVAAPAAAGAGGPVGRGGGWAR